jgi:hypothetical protein
LAIKGFTTIPNERACTTIIVQFKNHLLFELNAQQRTRAHVIHVQCCRKVRKLEGGLQLTVIQSNEVLKAFFSSNSIAQKANEIFSRISASASKMGEKK